MSDIERFHCIISVTAANTTNLILLAMLSLVNLLEKIPVSISRYI